MREKETITEENYKEKTLKRAIIICWILLAICFIVKICGGNFFDISVESNNFIIFCNYCDNSFIKYIFYYPVFMIESCLLLLMIKPNLKIKSKKFLLYFLFTTLYWVVKILSELEIIKAGFVLTNIIPFLVLYVLLFAFSKRPLASLVIMVYQLVLVLLSSVIRNISFNGLMTDSFMITTIFLIDYYIALVISYLYCRKKYLKRSE